MIFSLLLSLLGCSIADAGSAQSTETTRGPKPELSVEALQAVDAQGANYAMQWVLQDIQALSPRQRDRAAQAMATLAVNCSYTRASHQLPLVLAPKIQALNPEHLNPAAREDLAQLKEGIHAQVALLDALSVDLPMPQQGDFLYGHPNLVDRAGLALLQDPVANTSAQLNNIRTDFPPQTQALVSANFEQVESITGHHSAFKPHLLGWLNVLYVLQPQVKDPSAQEQVQALIWMLEDYAGRGC